MKLPEVKDKLSDDTIAKRESWPDGKYLFFRPEEVINPEIVPKIRSLPSIIKSYHPSDLQLTFDPNYCMYIHGKIQPVGMILVAGENHPLNMEDFHADDWILMRELPGATESE